MTAATTTRRASKPRPVKRKTGKRSASPTPVPELADRVRSWAGELGRLPSQREVKNRFRVGQTKARDVLDEAARVRLRLVGQTAPETAPEVALEPVSESAPETVSEPHAGVHPEPAASAPSTPAAGAVEPPVNRHTGAVSEAVSEPVLNPEPEPLQEPTPGPHPEVRPEVHPGPVSGAVPEPLPGAATVASTERWGGSFLVTDRAPGELERDRQVDTEIRQAWRDERQRAALAEAGRHRREAEAHDRIADQATDDRVWQARAVSEVERQTGAAAYIVALVKARRIFTRVCLGLLAGATVWGALNAHATMMTTVDNANPLVNLAFYLVDPLVTVLLIGLLWVRSVVSARGDSLGSRALVGIELALLTTTVILNAGPFLPVFGKWITALAAFSHMVPAGVITLTVLAYPIVDRLTALKLRAARAELARL